MLYDERKAKGKKEEKSENLAKQLPSGVSEQPGRKGSEGLEGSQREVNRGGVVATRAVIGDNDIYGFALPGNPDGLAAV
jgi:hypothetical protein